MLNLLKLSMSLFDKRCLYVLHYNLMFSLHLFCRLKEPVVLVRGTTKLIHCVEDVVERLTMFKKRNVHHVGTLVQKREDVSRLDCTFIIANEGCSR